jgi:hypothetical protein
MPYPLWILNDPEDEVAASAITAKLEAAGIQKFHVGEDESETGAEEIHVLANDYDEAWEIVESVLSSGTKKLAATTGPPWELAVPLILSILFSGFAFSRSGIESYILAAAAAVSLLVLFVLLDRRLEQRKKTIKRYK